ncbi:nicotinate phosphoribosyltransferase [Candidatus Dojkabacteria bacterium]|nr:nicotinate phosphoribosyltransferase [Candidatus Dojkabacteria bacterium]
MKQIINSILDTDLYTFSLCYLYLQKFPRAVGRYSFIDRNNTSYPKGFAEKVQKQIKMMENIKFSNDESIFMSKNCQYYPTWYFIFLKGYKFNSSEVTVNQDEYGHLNINIEGYLWRTVFWEQPILAIVSELAHKMNGDFDKYDNKKEYKKSYDKCKKLIDAKVNFSEFGTRRRFSYNHQKLVVKSFVNCMNDYNNGFGLIGTSNVHFAMMFNIKPLGTMAHQYISLIASIYGPVEANNVAMNIWEDVYQGDLGTYLYDTLTRNVFMKNFSLKNAILFDGIRVDSGSNIEALEDFILKYKSLGIIPSTKTIIFSNALDVDTAIEIHKIVDNGMKDSYGIGTHFTCDIDNVKPSNMVIKLTSAKITENREWNNCVKFSDDKGKYTGNKDTIEVYKKLLNIE